MKWELSDIQITDHGRQKSDQSNCGAKMFPFIMQFVFAGPFWICATLVFAIAISGNISNVLVHLQQPSYKYVPEFRKGKLCFDFKQGQCYIYTKAVL